MCEARPRTNPMRRSLWSRSGPKSSRARDTGPTQIDDYVTTHRILIQSPLIVERAIRQGNLGSLQTFAGETGDLTEAVIKRLSVGQASPDASGNPAIACCRCLFAVPLRRSAARSSTPSSTVTARFSTKPTAT